MSINRINDIEFNDSLALEAIQETPYIRRKTKEETEWELRTLRRRAIFDEMTKLGPFAQLTQVSLLIGLEKDLTVRNLATYTNANLTLKTSVMYNSIRRENRAALCSMQIDEYNRKETAYRDFSAGFMLAVKENINHKDYLLAFWKLKKWCVVNPTDEVCKHLKSELKKAQAIFLRAGMPDSNPSYPSVYKDIPELYWVHEAFEYGTRDYNLTVEQAYLLTQIANFTRAGPYPSHEMVTADVEETINMVKSEKSIPHESKISHYGGLRQIHDRLGSPDNRRTHVSLSGSGSYELGRASGGKAAYIVCKAKRITSLKIESLEELYSMTNLYDCLDQLVVHNEVAHMAANIIRSNHPLTWGDVLYVPPERAALELTSLDEQKVPFGLAQCIILICTLDIKKIGHYDKPETPNHFGVPLFNKQQLPVVFEPTVDSLPVKASMSIEGAGKSRMVTSTMAAITEIGELMNHFMRNWLSKDPFCRIGFEEQDKLWEVLKHYAKENPVKSSD